MFIFLGRHSDAGATSSDPTEERDRELTKVGSKMAFAVARFLSKQTEVPKVILASTYCRAVETGDIYGAKLGVQVACIDELVPHVPIRPFVEELLGDDDSKRIMLIGHHDNFDPFIEDVLGDDSGPLVKAEVRCFRIERDDVKDAKLVWRVRPSDVGYEDIE